MPSARRSIRLPGTMTWLLVGGLAAVATGLLAPTWSASRVARLEERAEWTARIALEEAVARIPFDFSDPGTVEALVAAIDTRLQGLDVPGSSRPALVTHTEEAVELVAKHHVFWLTREPAPVPTPPGYDPTVRRSFEVYAWPVAKLGPVHSAFFFPEEGPAAFSRNLLANYRGPVADGGGPRAGDGRPRDELAANAYDYRGRDDERWLLMPSRDR